MTQSPCEGVANVLYSQIFPSSLSLNFVSNPATHNYYSTESNTTQSLFDSAHQLSPPALIRELSSSSTTASLVDTSSYYSSSYLPMASSSSSPSAFLDALLRMQAHIAWQSTNSLNHSSEQLSKLLEQVGGPDSMLHTLPSSATGLQSLNTVSQLMHTQRNQAHSRTQIQMETPLIRIPHPSAGSAAASLPVSSFSSPKEEDCSDFAEPAASPDSEFTPISNSNESNDPSATPYVQTRQLSNTSLSIDTHTLPLSSSFSSSRSSSTLLLQPSPSPSSSSAASSDEIQPKSSIQYSLAQIMRHQTVRKKREAFRYDEETRRTRRLEDHRRYDRKRKRIITAVFDELKAVLSSSVAVAEQAGAIVMKEESQLKQDAENQVEERKKVRIKKEASQGDASDAPTIRYPEAAKNLPSLSHYDLYSTAASAIRFLQNAQEELELPLKLTELELQIHEELEKYGLKLPPPLTIPFPEPQIKLE